MQLITCGCQIVSDHNHLTITAQMPGIADFKNGIQQSDKWVVGLDQKLGLMSFSQSLTGIASASAKLAVEILIDDMQTNVPLPGGLPGDKNLSSALATCLSESLANINEYLHTQASADNEATATNLTVFHYWNGYLSFASSKEIDCILLRNEKTRLLDSGLSNSLGLKSRYQSKVQSEAMFSGDILFIATRQLTKTIGEEYIRLTLARFHNNLSTALRQINTRLSHLGNAKNSMLIICQINQQDDTKQGWMRKLKNR